MKKGDVLNRTGERGINSKGFEMVIVDYRKSNDIDVLFTESNVKVKTRYDHFKNGLVKMPSPTAKQIKLDRKKNFIDNLNHGINNGFIKIIPGRRYYADINGVIYNNKGETVKPFQVGNYLCVDLPNENCKHGRMLVHRAVCSAFIPNPENKPQVNHKDGNKFNYRLDNLEWVTRSENQKHRFEVLGHSLKGEKNNLSKLKDSDIIRIVELYNSGESKKDICIKFGVCLATVCGILNGKTWTHVTSKILKS